MDKLFKQLGIYPKNQELYERAFRHSSYTNESSEELANYERLEFLGDALIDLVVTKFLYTSFNLDEGVMSSKRSNFVCEKALGTYADSIGLADYILVGVGEEMQDTRHKDSILSDVFEALFGAIFLEYGYDQTEKILLKVLKPYINNLELNFCSNYKSKFQELVQTGDSKVEYILAKDEGPDHDKTFTIAVRVDGVVFGEGTASNKKDAEQLAAKVALKKYTKGGK